METCRFSSFSIMRGIGGLLRLARWGAVAFASVVEQCIRSLVDLWALGTAPLTLSARTRRLARFASFMTRQVPNSVLA
jgi:hypothetical protein